MDTDGMIYFGGEVKALGDGKVGGYLVRYGDPDTLDLTGQFFSKETDLGNNENVPLYYNHGMDEHFGKHRLRRAELSDDELGKWAQSQFDMRDEYEAFLYGMVEAGKMGWSSGTAGHLVEIEPVPGKRAEHIKSWPIVEASLTPTPAEPRNSAIPIKSLLTANGGHDVAPAEVETEQLTNFNSKDGNKMDELETKTEPVDVAAIARQAAEEAAKAYFEAQPVNKVAKSAPAILHVPLGQPELGDAFKAWSKEGDLRGMKALGQNVSGNDWHVGYVKNDPIAMKAAMQEGTTTEGGFLVNNDFWPQIVAKRAEQSVIRALLAASGGIVHRTTRDVMDFPVEDTAITDFTLTAEEGSYNEAEPTFALKQATIYKYTKMLKVSEELLDDDATNLESFLVDGLARAAAGAENNAVILGTGSGQPEGVFVGGSVGATAADTNAIVAAEIPELFFSLGSQYHANAAFVMDPATMGHLQGITGSPFQFWPLANAQPGSGQMGYSFWAGKPAYLVSDVADIATGAKVMLVGDFGYYGFVERAGMTISRNPYLYQANGQVGIFAKMRFGGLVLQSEAFKWLIMA